MVALIYNFFWCNGHLSCPFFWVVANYKNSSVHTLMPQLRLEPSTSCYQENRSIHEATGLVIYLNCLVLRILRSTLMRNFLTTGLQLWSFSYFFEWPQDQAWTGLLLSSFWHKFLLERRYTCSQLALAKI